MLHSLKKPISTVLLTIHQLSDVMPENLPPINRTNLIKGTLREKFNSTYKELLSGFEYRLNNEKQTLEFKSKNLCWRELLARVFPIHFFMMLSGIKK
jgi:hypothetical protein